MDTNEMPGQSPGRGLLRRRIVFELEASQLPMLEAAEARHGSKRAALLAALEAEGTAAELIERAERAEAELARQARATTKAKNGGSAEATAKLKRELDSAKRKLAKADTALAKAKETSVEGEAALREQIRGLNERLADAKEEAAELRSSAVDWIHCQRCGEWAGPEEWEWEDFEDGGSYAYHVRCGDYDEDRKGSSWLAQRA